MEKDMLEHMGLPGCGVPVQPRMDVEENGACGCEPVCRGYEGCRSDSWGLCDRPLAIVYAPCQLFRALYDPATALSRGTLFTELDLPLGETDSCGFNLIGASCRADR